MIVNQCIVNDVVNELAKSEFEFYLTGSRFFGHNRTDSDFDFFVEHSQEVVEFLHSLGFQKECSAYNDCSAHSVYCNPVANVHVQVLKNKRAAYIKEITQNLMKKHNILPIFVRNREDERIWWNQFLTIVDELVS